MDGLYYSREFEERAVQDTERDLANGGRERRKQEVLRTRAFMRKAGIPFVKVNNPLPSW